MAAGGNISTILTLDASKFSTALDKATGDLSKFDTGLKAATKIAADFEKNVGSIGGGLPGISDKFKLLDATIDSFAKKLVTASERFEKAASGTRTVKKAVDDLNSGLNPIQRSLSTVTRETDSMRVAMEALKPSLARAVQGQNELAAANANTAASYKKSAADGIRAQMEAMTLERSINGEKIAAKRKLLWELEELERKTASEAAVRRRTAADAEKRLGVFGGKNIISSNSTEADRLELNSASARTSAQAVMAEVEALKSRNRLIAESIPMMNLQAQAADEASKRQATASVQADLAERQAADERKTRAASAKKEAAEAARQAETAKRQESAMWRQVEQDKVREARAAAKETARVLKDAEDYFKQMGKEVTAAEKKQAAERVAIAKAEAADKKAAAKAMSESLKAEEKVRRAEERAAGVQATAEYRQNKLAQREAHNAMVLAERQAAQELRAATLEQIRLAREAANEQKAQAQQIAQMWKGMAQMWAASKIESGLAASVKASDDYARVLERLDAAGVDGAAGKRRTLEVSKQVEQANPNMSKTDALKLTMSGVAGTVSTDKNMLGTVIPEIAKVLTVMTRQFPEQAHNLEDFGRNVMGVMEARAITNNPEKMLATLDNLSRALILTQGKMSVQDYETISRRGGAGNAQLKDDDSILYDIAAASQMKVMGGGSGGGAGGVSSFATMQKQAAKGQQGGILEKRSALENLVEFGVIDKEELLKANGGKPLGRNAKAVPYIGAENAAENSTKFAIDLVDKIKKKLAALPESDLRFFAKGANRQDDAVQAQAFGRFADQSFSNTSRAEFYKMFASTGSSERIEAEVQKSKEAPSYGKSHEEAMKSWGVQTDITKKALTDLGVVVGDVLIPVLKPLLETVTKIVRGLQSFGEANPAAAQLGVLAVAATGVTFAIKGFTSMFGVVGSLTGMLKGMAGSTATVAVSAASAAKAGTGMERAFGAGGLSETLGKANINIGETAAKLTGMAGAATSTSTTVSSGMATMASNMMGAGAKMIGVAARIGVGMLQIVPIVGQLATLFLLTDWLANLEVGGASIGAWASSFADGFVTTIEVAMLRARAIFSSDAAELLKQSDKLLSDLKKRQVANGTAEPDKPGVTEHESPADMESRQEREFQAKQKADERKAQRAKEAAALAAKTKAAEKAASGSAGTTDVSGLFAAGKGGKAPRVSEDMFLRAIAKEEAAANIAKLKFNTVDGAGESYADQAKEKVKGLWLSGDLDKDRKPTNREGLLPGFKKQEDATKYTAEMIDWDNEKIKRLIAAYEATGKLVDQTKALKYANERGAATSREADEAAKRIAEGLNHESAAMRALRDEFARFEEANPSAVNTEEYAKSKSKALSDRARADLNAYSLTLPEKTAASESKFKESKDGALLSSTQIAGNKFDEETAKEKKAHDTAIAAIDAEMKAQANSTEQYEKLSNDRIEAEKRYDAYLNARKAERAHTILNPLEKLVEGWKNTSQQIETIEASWAEKMMSGLESIATGGVTSFVDLREGVKGILGSMAKDVSGMLMKQAMGDITGKIATGLGGAAKDLIGGIKGMSKGEGESGAIDGVMSMFSKVKDGLGNFWTSITGAGSATESLTGAVGETIAKSASEVLGITTKMTAEQAATASLMALSSAASAASVSMGGSTGGVGGLFGSLFGGGDMNAGVAASQGLDAADIASAFAMGGIMSSAGSLPLKMYAGGGVANSPQMAIFGEGAMNEAYVPLPDGRSIPVTMKLAAQAQGQSGAPAGDVVTIQINVSNDGAATGGKTGGADDAGTWTRVADRVRGVVREEMLTQRRPGGILNQ